MRNWIMPKPASQIEVPLSWVDQRPMETGVLAVGSLFRSKRELKVAVGLHHMENFIEYTTDRSNTERLALVCEQGRKSCTFRLCAVQGGSIWRITKLTMEHTCHENLDWNVNQTVAARVAATYLSRRLIGEGVQLRPRDIVNEMKVLFGIKMEYAHALRSRDLSIEIVYGDFEMSYHRLPSYLYLLRERNPGTVYDLQVTRDGKFCQMFVALGQCIRTFQRSLQPIIIVDGTHMKCKNTGILFVAVGTDGDDHVFSLAVGLGPVENEESWTWFLLNLKRCYDPPEEFLIVSDQHKGIKNAVESVYPNAFHALCFYHLKKNLVSYGSHVCAIFQSAVYCDRAVDFDMYFEALRSISRDGAYARLCDIGVERWAKCKSPVPRYGLLTSNLAESMNSRLLWARRLPVCSMLEAWRLNVDEWFDRRRGEALSRQHPITEVAYKKLGPQVEIGLHLNVRDTYVNVYKVEQDRRTYDVDLQNWTCSCCEFDQDRMPCRHASSAIRRAGLSVYDFVSPYFKTDTLRAPYEESIHGVPHPDDWATLVPEYIAMMIVTAPDVVPQAGRPRSVRFHSGLENATTRQRAQKCRNYGASGHNRRVCTSRIGQVDLNNPPPNSEGPSRRAKKKCSVCGSQDHTKSKCPMRFG